MNRHFGRLALAILFSLTLTLEVSAETVAQTARKWGLIGSWSLDCSLPPDRNKGTVLAYVIAPDGRVLHRRNFGESTDESEVIAANTALSCSLTAPFVRCIIAARSANIPSGTANSPPTATLLRHSTNAAPILHAPIKLNNRSELFRSSAGTFPGIQCLILIQWRSET